MGGADMGIDVYLNMGTMPAGLGNGVASGTSGKKSRGIMVLDPPSFHVDPQDMTVGSLTYCGMGLV